MKEPAKELGWWFANGHRNLLGAAPGVGGYWGNMDIMENRKETTIQGLGFREHQGTQGT